MHVLSAHAVAEQRLDGPCGGQKLMDVRLLLARRSPSSLLEVLLSFLPSPSRDRAASDQAPVTSPHGVVAARRPLIDQIDQNGPTPHVPQPLLHVVRRLRASLALLKKVMWRC